MPSEDVPLSKLNVAEPVTGGEGMSAKGTAHASTSKLHVPEKTLALAAIVFTIKVRAARTLALCNG